MANLNTRRKNLEWRRHCKKQGWPDTVRRSGPHNYSAVAESFQRAGGYGNRPEKKKQSLQFAERGLHPFLALLALQDALFSELNLRTF